MNTRYYPVTTQSHVLQADQCESIMQLHEFTRPQMSIDEAMTTEIDFFRYPDSLRKSPAMPFYTQAVTKHYGGAVSSLDSDVLVEAAVMADLRVCQFNPTYEHQVSLKQRLRIIDKHYPNFASASFNFERAGLDEFIVALDNYDARWLLLTRTGKSSWIISVQREGKQNFVLYRGPLATGSKYRDNLRYNLFRLLVLLRRHSLIMLASHMVGLVSDRALNTVVRPAMRFIDGRIVDLVDNRTTHDKKRTFPINHERLSSLLYHARCFQKRLASPVIDNSKYFTFDGLGYIRQIEVVRYQWADNATVAPRVTDYERGFIIPVNVIECRAGQGKTKEGVNALVDYYQNNYLAMAKGIDLANKPITDRELANGTAFILYIDDVAMPRFLLEYESLDHTVRVFRKHNQVPGMRLGMNIR